MLTIRDEQMARFREARLHQAEQRMAARARNRFPSHSDRCGELGLRSLARVALGRAASYRMMTEASATLFLELMLKLGIDFDHDPQLPFARVLKEPAASEKARARLLRREARRYIAKVEGRNGAFLSRAMRRMADFPVEWDPEPAICFDEERVRALRALYPRKCARMEEGGVERLVAMAAGEASRRGLGTPEGKALLSALMLLGGPGVLDDPRFPYVREALEQGRGIDPRRRVAHLQAAFSGEIQRRFANVSEPVHVG